jgi:iron complex outermembrane recepter protein
MNASVPRPRLPGLRGVFSLCLAVTAGAQSVSPSAQSSPQQQPVELSPFVVDDSKDVGYLAANTLAGSRFNTALKDTPATISVITSEFISDIGAFQIEEALNYAVNIEFFRDDDREAINGNANFQGYQAVRTRGLDSSRSRNFFTLSGRAVPDEMAFVDRIEDSRGPNSVMFGIAQPGGMLNTGTKQAQGNRAFRKLSATYGSYDSWRATLDVNQPLLKGKLAVRLNLVYNENNTFRNFEHQKHQRGMISATYKLSDRTRIRAEFERGQLETNKPVDGNLTGQALTWMALGRPSNATQTANAAQTLTRLNANRRVTLITNDNSVFDMRQTLITSGSNNVITDRRIADDSINFGGLAQNRYSRFGILSAFFEHQFSKNTFLELGFNHSEQSFDNRDPRVSANQLLGDPNQLLNGPNDTLNTGGANPFARQLYVESNWFRTVRWDQSDTGRAQLSHELDLKKWGAYRFALASEYEKRWFLSRTFRELWYNATTGALGPFNAVPDNVNNNVIRRTYVTEGKWDTYSVSGPVGSGGLLTNLRDRVTGLNLGSAWMIQAAPNETFIEQKSGMVVAQARYFKNRLVVQGGLRRDEYDEFRLATARNGVTQIFGVIRDPNAPGTTSNSAIARTKTAGGVLHALPWLSFFYNIANNASVPANGQFMLNASGDPMLGPPLPVPKPVGKGEDFGIGISLLQDKLYLKVTRYTTEGTDQSTTSPSIVRTINQDVLDGLLGLRLISQAEHDKRIDVGGHGLFGHQSKGTEIQFTGNPVKNWRFQLNWSESKPIENYRFREWLTWEGVNAKFLSQFNQSMVVGSRTLTVHQTMIHDELIAQTKAVGIGKLGNREHKVNLFTRYDIPFSPLKGVYVGGGYQHQSKMFVGTIPATGEKLFGNSYWRADALLGYNFRGLAKDRKLSLQLNVYNVFNMHDPLIIRYDPTNPRVIFRNVLQSPTTWRLTTNFEF